MTGVVLALVMSAGLKTPADAAALSTSGIEVMLPAEHDRIHIGTDGSLERALERASIAPGDVHRIMAETSEHSEGGRLTAGTRVDVRIAPRAPTSEYREVDAMSVRVRLDRAIEFRRVDGQLVASVREISVDGTPFRVVGRFGGDVRGTLAAYGIDQAAIDEYVRIIGTQMDIADIARGDQFDVIVEHSRAETGETRTGPLIYAGLTQQNGARLRMSQWTRNGRLTWYDATKASRSIDNVQRPVPGEVSSRFGPRMHPILRYTRFHQGLDFRGGFGTPILAAQTGWVTRAGMNRGYGNQVELTHGGGIVTTYAHMSRMAVNPGTLVQQGQVIGYIGSTGLSTGPHLHFEVIRNGERVDPAKVQFTVGPQLRGEDLRGYERRLNALLAVPVGRSRPVAPERT